MAYNRETKQFVPFQILSTRKKTEESADTAKVQVIVQAFDLMYINGESLLQKPLEERRASLTKHFHTIEGKFRYDLFFELQFVLLVPLIVNLIFFIDLFMHMHEKGLQALWTFKKMAILQR